MLARLIFNTPLEGFLRKVLNKPKIEFTNSSEYWDLRYQKEGDSGAGSYGRLAEFKAEIINQFVKEHQIESLIEFGCGDGAQLELAEYTNYIGVDVSKTIIATCKEKFAGDETKRFVHTDEYNQEQADLSMSLDVIYHLVEDPIFEGYMRNLFAAAKRYVIIYSSDKEETQINEHVRHRKFTQWVERNIKDFEFVEKIPNKYPYSELNRNQTSFADFYIYKRRA